MRAKIGALTGRQTLTDSDIRALSALGFTFTTVQDPKVAGHYGKTTIARNDLPQSPESGNVSPSQDR